MNNLCGFIYRKKQILWFYWYFSRWREKEAQFIPNVFYVTSYRANLKIIILTTAMYVFSLHVTVSENTTKYSVTFYQVCNPITKLQLNDSNIWRKCLLAAEEYASLVLIKLKLLLYSVTKLFWYPTLLGLFIAKICTFNLRLLTETFIFDIVRFRLISQFLKEFWNVYWIRIMKIKLTIKWSEDRLSYNNGWFEIDNRRYCPSLEKYSTSRKRVQ